MCKDDRYIDLHLDHHSLVRIKVEVIYNGCQKVSLERLNVRTIVVHCKQKTNQSKTVLSVLLDGVRPLLDLKTTFDRSFLCYRLSGKRSDFRNTHEERCLK